MAYIGNTQLNQNYVPAVDFFSGNGSTTAFTLSRPVASVAAIQAVISNVPQDPGTAFTVSGSTITFTSAPPSGTNNIYVYYTSPNTQVVQPGQGTVGPTQIDGNYALWNKSGSNINYTAGNVGISTSNTPSNRDTVTPKLVVNGAGVAGAMQVVRNTTPGGGGALIELTATRGSDVNSYTILQSGDGVGTIAFGGADGNEFVRAGSISCQVDGTPGDNDMPGRLVFSTTSDGASGDTERMRIDSSGNVGIGQSPSQKLDVLGNARVNGTSAASFSFLAYQSDTGSQAFFGFDNSSGLAQIGNASNNPLRFLTNNTEQMRLTSAGILQFNSGYGSVANAYGCRAWVNFNGTGTVAIRASGNVTSITDNGTGAYVVNLTNAMPDTNYAPISCGNNTAGSAAQNSMYNSTPVTTSTFTVNIVTNGGGPRDDAVVTSAVFR